MKSRITQIKSRIRGDISLIKGVIDDYGDYASENNKKPYPISRAKIKQMEKDLPKLEKISKLIRKVR